jgi:hypothetical protein
MDVLDRELLREIIEVSPEWVLIELCEQVGIPVLSKATADAMKDMRCRLETGEPISDEELVDVLYAVGVSLDAAGKLRCNELSCHRSGPHSCFPEFNANWGVYS